MMGVAKQIEQLKPSSNRATSRRMVEELETLGLLTTVYSLGRGLPPTRCFNSQPHCALFCLRRRPDCGRQSPAVSQSPDAFLPLHHPVRLVCLHPRGPL